MNREIMLAVGFGKSLDLIKEDKCPTCSAEIDHNFRDELRLKEYKISGMCQDCQDKIFNLKEG
jgi:DNA-directed RNA polymerase subunit RPC12/RpoP